jgi:thiol-disulfide isomerase/thioredoxin
MKLIFLIIALILVSICVFVSYYYSTIHKEYMDNIGKPMLITLFKASWCPHCRNLQPAWEQIVNDYNNKTINNHKITFKTIECSNRKNDEEVESLCKKYNVSGYPYIVATIGNNIIPLKANPTTDSITLFIEETSENY